MFKRSFKIVAAVFICLLVGLVILVAVTIRASGGGGSGGTLATGRAVGTNSDGWSTSATYGRDTATITTAGHTIVVAPTKLVVDGNAVATIDEGVKAVTVTVRRGEVSFVADGRAVVQYTR
jgi:hypothetical protein